MTWIGVDLDGTLAKYAGYHGPTDIGDPIEPMVKRVKQWRKEGITVKVFTARVYANPTDAERVLETIKAREAIERWCIDHIGERLPVTCEKDYGMWQLWDDRAVRIVSNKGEPCCDHHSSE